MADGFAWGCVHALVWPLSPAPALALRWGPSAEWLCLWVNASAPANAGLGPGWAWPAVTASQRYFMLDIMVRIHEARGSILNNLVYLLFCSHPSGNSVFLFLFNSRLQHLFCIIVIKITWMLSSMEHSRKIFIWTHWAICCILTLSVYMNFQLIWVHCSYWFMMQFFISCILNHIFCSRKANLGKVWVICKYYF